MKNKSILVKRNRKRLFIKAWQNERTLLLEHSEDRSFRKASPEQQLQEFDVCKGGKWRRGKEGKERSLQTWKKLWKHLHIKNVLIKYNFIFTFNLNQNFVKTKGTFVLVVFFLLLQYHTSINLVSTLADNSSKYYTSIVLLDTLNIKQQLRWTQL